jgi:hypothetical protein
MADQSQKYLSDVVKELVSQMGSEALELIDDGTGKVVHLEYSLVGGGRRWSWLAGGSC